MIGPSGIRFDGLVRRCAATAASPACAPGTGRRYRRSRPVGISKSNLLIGGSRAALCADPISRRWRAAPGRSRPVRCSPCRGDHADAPGALHPDAIGGQQLFVFVDLRRSRTCKTSYVAARSRRRSRTGSAADAEGMRRKARAAVLLENLQNLFPVAEGIEQRRHGADVERVRAQPEHVAGDAVQLGQDDADVLRPAAGLPRSAVFQPLRSSPARWTPPPRNPCGPRRD